MTNSQQRVALTSAIKGEIKVGAKVALDVDDAREREIGSDERGGIKPSHVTPNIHPMPN